jgi:N-acyl-D-amino-acid deacylase
MTMAYDLLIRGGTVVDGSGLPPYRGDVGITGERIVAIGDLKGQAAKRTIDAEGKVVSPGFIDAHTHMDAQVFWDKLGTCSCWHGVTSVVMGNCGFTLAPCPEKDKALVIHNLERAEDIPPAAMEAGIPWSWETFPQYLDAVAKAPKGINYAGYVGHSALRTYVMGRRAFTEKANADDMAALKKELEASLRAGAIGMSTSRSGSHRTPEGLPVASRLADWSEVEQLVGVMSKLGAGIFEISRESTDDDPEKRREEQQRLKKLAVESKVPFTFGSSWYKRDATNIWRGHFAMVDDAVAQGAKMMIQGTSAWQSSLRSFETLLPFDKMAVWADFRKLPLAQQEKGLRDPEMRKKLVEAVHNHKHQVNPAFPNAFRRPIDWNWVMPMDRPLPPFRSVAEIAKATGKDPVDVVIDMALERHLKMFFIAPNNNEDQGYVLANIRHPHSVVTFSDAGAHVATTLNPMHTHLLGHWVRQAQEVTLEAAVRKITFDIASFWGLTGRGLLREGYIADVVVFDPETIAPEMPTVVNDLPSGAKRLLQKATGIENTIVAGQVLLHKGEHTGALPGRVLRGPLASN